MNRRPIEKELVDLKWGDPVSYNIRIEAVNGLIDFLRHRDPQAEDSLVFGLATLLAYDFPMHALEALHAELSHTQAPTFEKAAVRAVEFLGYSDGRILRIRREALDGEVVDEPPAPGNGAAVS